MTSNKFKRSGAQPKWPAPCVSKKKKKQRPKAQLTCDFTPAFIKTGENSPVTTFLHAENLDLPVLDSFDVLNLTPDGPFEGPPTVLNTDVAEWTYHAREGPGSYVRIVQITDTLGNKCFARVEIEVSPLGGDPPP